MKTRKLSFYSDGLRLDALLQRAEGDVKAPILVVCSGLHGLKEWVPGKWAPYALKAGFQCFAFDYRGFGTSQGERGRIFPAEQVRDTIHALDFIRGLEGVDVNRIAILGWGLGAGVAICAAAQDLSVAAVCSANGAGDYGRTVRDATEYPRLQRWLERLRKDRLSRAQTGKSEMVDYRNLTNPGFDPNFSLSPQFHKDISSVGQRPEQLFSLESCEAYMNFRPEDVVAQLAPRPFLIVHGERNHFMPISEAHRLYKAAGKGGFLKTFPGQGHLELISEDNPDANRLMTATVAALRKAVAGEELRWQRE